MAIQAGNKNVIKNVWHHIKGANRNSSPFGWGGGDLSKYGLSNAITRTSNDLKDYDRAVELEGIDWEVATMESRIWEQINDNAYGIEE